MNKLYSYVGYLGRMNYNNVNIYTHALSTNRNILLILYIISISHIR